MDLTALDNEELFRLLDARRRSYATGRNMVNRATSGSGASYSHRLRLMEAARDRLVAVEDECERRFGFANR